MTAAKTAKKPRTPPAPAPPPARPTLTPAGRLTAARLLALLRSLAANAHATAEAFAGARAELSDADRALLEPLVQDLAGSSVFVTGRRDYLERLVRRGESAPKESAE